MQGEDEINKLYEILDSDGKKVGEIGNKYIESIKRRLNRTTLMEKPEHPTTPVPPAVELPKPKVRIVFPRPSRRKASRPKEEKRSIDDLLEIEKISAEELRHILETKKESEEVKEEPHPEAQGIMEIPEETKENFSKEEFIRTISKVRGIGEKRAKMLYESGFDSFEKIIEAKPREISKKVRGISADLARKLKREIKRISRLTTKEEDIPEWETVDKTEPYRYEDYTLYMVEKRGKIKYVFSKKPPRKGKPCQIPEGYVVRISRRGVPSLEKIK